MNLSKNYQMDIRQLLVKVVQHYLVVKKQRISIARAILKDAPIIILDEATSSVDPENQHALLTAINELTCGKNAGHHCPPAFHNQGCRPDYRSDNGHVVQQGDT